MSNIFGPLLGGIIIGTASSLLLIGVGRISGISSILAQTISRPVKEEFWKYFFLLGLVVGSILFLLISPEDYEVALDISKTEIILGGLLVGIGTRLGSGCTSGHGVCGISRLSRRSILATLIFISTGVLTVAVKGAF